MVGGHRPRLLAPQREAVHALLAQMPHRSVRALRDELAALGIRLCQETLRSLLHAEELSFKNPPSPLSGTARTWLGGAPKGRRLDSPLPIVMERSGIGWVDRKRLVRVEGLEPPRPCGHQILSPRRSNSVITYTARIALYIRHLGVF